MLFSRGVCLAINLTCVLPLSISTFDQAGHRMPASRSQDIAVRQAGTLASIARREWDSNRDWLRFTTGILGDTAITDHMKALLGSGVAPGTQDKFGRTALHAAAMLGQVELTRFLLARGADINARDREGRTPLMLVASAGGFDLFTGFAPTSPWEFFWTEPLCQPEASEVRDRRVKPLRDWYSMVAAEEPMLKLLLNARADVAATDGTGRDAFDHAALGGPTGFARMLRGRTSAGEQPHCDLASAQSPEVRGLRLGMELREVAARLRRSSLPEADSCGRQALQLDWAANLLGQPAPRLQELKDVRRIGLGFLDGRLAYFRVTYTAPLKPAEFRSTLSAALRLPERWRRAGGEGLWDEPYSISCEGFTVIAGWPYVELIDEVALQTLLQRDADARLRRLREVEAERERRRREFKP
jgi:hypothetical protein